MLQIWFSKISRRFFSKVLRCNHFDTVIVKRLCLTMIFSFNTLQTDRGNELKKLIEQPESKDTNGWKFSSSAVNSPVCLDCTAFFFLFFFFAAFDCKPTTLQTSHLINLWLLTKLKSRLLRISLFFLEQWMHHCSGSVCNTASIQEKRMKTFF